MGLTGWLPLVTLLLYFTSCALSHPALDNVPLQEEQDNINSQVNEVLKTLKETNNLKISSPIFQEKLSTLPTSVKRKLELIIEVIETKKEAALLDPIAKTIEIAEFMIANDADPNFKDAKGETVLHKAVEFGRFNAVQWLVNDQKVNVMEKDRYGRNVLHFAAIRGHLNILQWLLEHEPNLDINGRDLAGNTPLFLSTNNPEVLIWLIEQRNADYNVKNVNNWTLLHESAYWDQISTLQWLKNHTNIDVNLQNNKGNTALHLASKYLDTVILLVQQYGADVTIKNNKQQTVLDKAKVELDKEIDFMKPSIQEVIDWLKHNTVLTLFN